ncbi:hypothetical protein ACIRD6_36370 [Streptomyces sp. NPDC102473]|uniref:hypothetical protein n=1 Tax=Streptomyces sp. NPDC102473 TaxID=3366180 RepID=UPI0037F62ACA
MGGGDNPVYRAKVLGEFPTDAANQVVRQFDVANFRAATDRRPKAEELEPVELGVDVGGAPKAIPSTESRRLPASLHGVSRRSGCVPLAACPATRRSPVG